MARPNPLRHLEVALTSLEQQGLLRDPAAARGVGEGLLNLCSNDYLGYAAEPCPGAPLAGGAGASRLVSGNHPAHEQAEQAIMSWLGMDAALLFSSGYAANLGTIAALAGPSDVIVSDALNHASIVDGCRLSRAAIRVVPHLDLEAVGRELSEARSSRRRWVVTESYFSMDGDSPDLGELRALCDVHDAALVVDEAHAVGVFGPRGAGLCAEAGIAPDVLIGTAGKALGLQGAFVAGSSLLRKWLWNRARPFVFSTGISPALATAIGERVMRAAADESSRARLRSVESQLREGLSALGVAQAKRGRGPVIPWVLGSPEAAVAASRRLLERGVLVQAIRPPTVAEGTSRLRISAHARLTPGEIERALEGFRSCLG
jgi:8-amino-7-oxononanoate synthase